MLGLAETTVWRSFRRTCEPVAQLVEQRTFNPWVEGSIPSGLTTFFQDVRGLWLESETPSFFDLRLIVVSGCVRNGGTSTDCSTHPVHEPENGQQVGCQEQEKEHLCQPATLAQLSFDVRGSRGSLSGGGEQNPIPHRQIGDGG